MNTVDVETRRSVEAVDVTPLLAGAADIADGVLWISSPHTTAAVIVNEADADLLADVERTAAELLVPLEPFSHARNANPNAAAHLMAALLGRECLVLVSGGELALGEHQRVLLIELDGPKQRRLDVRALAVGAPEVRA